MNLAPVAGAVLAGTSIVLSCTAPADAAPRPTCHGVRATLVGQWGQHLEGTGHRDVIVTAGAEVVQASGGDDLVCVTAGARNVLVMAGAGDDRVFVTSQDSRVQLISGAGNDTYIGNRKRDLVNLTLDGKDRISTGRGNDVVEVNVRARGQEPRLSLGSGDRDRLWITSAKTRTGPFPDRVLVDLAKQRAVVSTSSTGRSRTLPVHGAEDVEVMNLSTVLLRGDGEDNRLVVQDSCRASLSGRGGDDLLEARSSFRPRPCPAPATSTADGGTGADSCSATVEISCESPVPRGARSTGTDRRGVSRPQ